MNKPATTTITTTTTSRLPPRWQRRVHLGLQRIMGDLAAASGDPVARWLQGRPRQNPYELYEQIRARGPVDRSVAGVRAVTSHALCEAVLREPTFGVQRADGSPITDPITEASSQALVGSLLELDPPTHTRLRQVAAPAFRPRNVRTWAPRIEATLHAILDRAERRARDHDGGFDLMADVAAPFPIAVITDLLGIPDVDAERFAAIGMVAGQALDGVRSLSQADELQRAGEELTALFTRLLGERATDPRDDVLSLLAAARVDGRITLHDALGLAGLLLVAGFETTVNLIGNGAAVLLAEPDRWDELVAEPTLAPAVVEEVLRWDPPVQGTARLAHAEADLAGVAVPAGAVILVLTAAANRDPGAYPEPARFDPHRTGQPDHLSFASGVHYCLGAPLARLEGEVAFRVLAERMAGLRLRPGARRRSGSTIRGFAHLPVAVGVG